MEKYNLYKIVQDPTSMGKVTFDSGDDETLEFDCYPIDEIINSHRFTIEDDSPCNFYFLDNGCLVFDAMVEDALQYPLELAGEVIPLTVEGDKKLYMSNVITCQNILDYKNSTILDSDHRKEITSYAFKANRIGMPVSLFKLPDDATHQIYCFTGLAHEGFYELYHEHNLIGLNFELIASFYDKDEGGSEFELAVFD